MQLEISARKTARKIFFVAENPLNKNVFWELEIAETLQKRGQKRRGNNGKFSAKYAVFSLTAKKAQKRLP